jgi:hypothetical protein
MPIPIIEQIRENTFDAATDLDAPLDFVPAALALGLSQREAEQADETLTIRIMRSRGAI